MYDIEYLFGFKNNMDLNILQTIYKKNTISNFEKIWIKFNDILDFSQRHETGISSKVYQDFKNCEKYLTTYGFVFFSNIDYTNLSDNSYLWIVSLFDFVYSHLSERLKEKLIKIIKYFTILASLFLILDSFLHLNSKLYDFFSDFDVKNYFIQ